MSRPSDRNELQENEIDLFVLIAGFKPVFQRYRRLIIGLPLFFFLAGALLSRLPVPEWEAVARLQTGRLSRLELIEPASNVILRLESAGFKAGVLGESGITEDSKEGEVYSKTLTAQEGSVSGLIEIRVRGLSKESAATLAQETARRIEKVHGEKIIPVIERLKKTREEARKAGRAVFSAATAGGSSSAPKNSFVEMFSLYFVNDLEHRLEGMAPTEILGITTGESPEYPRMPVWMGWGVVLGLFLGIALSLLLNSLFPPKPEA